MTQHYLAGELSLRLEQLEGVARERAVGELRREAERTPPAALSCVLMRALALSDSLCWDSLDRGDAAAFSAQAAISADLYEFGLFACLLEERSPG
jgi:hypothetical protein